MFITISLHIFAKISEQISVKFDLIFLFLSMNSIDIKYLSFSEIINTKVLVDSDIMLERERERETYLASRARIIK